MQSAEAQVGSEHCLAVCISETQSCEIESVLWQCAPALYRRAYRYLGNAADAEDAVQEALLSAYKHLYQFKGQAQMSTWLTAIVINSARMQLRRRSRQTHLSLDERLGEEQEYSWSERLSDHRPNPEDDFRESEMRAHLRKFVTHLSPTLRKVFQLREVEGLSTSETARILGVPIGTVKARLARARAQLVRLMQRALDVKFRSPINSKGLPVGARK
jgi:RNA polymerase sigma-70 factor, ECF subfamily